MATESGLAAFEPDSGAVKVVQPFALVLLARLFCRKPPDPLNVSEHEKICRGIALLNDLKLVLAFS